MSSQNVDLNHAERAHSPLGASACTRWWNCPGSIYLSKGIGNKSSIFAAEGTAAHELSQKCLESNTDAHKYLGNAIDGHVVTDEMADAVQEYVDECRLQAETATQPVMIETRITLERLHPPAPMFGTADFMCVQDDLLVVVDFKYGKGVPVSAVGNSQLKYYALGALLALPDDRKIARVKVEIVQPRARGPSIKIAEYDIVELLEWSVELIERARIALQPTAEVNPGEWCRFCPAAGICPAQADKALRQAQNDFTVETAVSTVVEVPPLVKLTPAELGKLLESADVIEGWIAAARRAAESMLALDPQGLPGWTMGPTRGTREWIGEKSAAAALEAAGMDADDIWVSTLISPAKAEDLIARDMKERKEAKTLKAAKEMAKDLIESEYHSISKGQKLIRTESKSSNPELDFGV